MIKGKRISLRPIELEDAKLLQSLMNDIAISDNVVGWSFPVSLYSQESWIRTNASDHSTYRFIIIDNETQDAIGLTGLWNIDRYNLSAESAIKILPSIGNKGVGTEALMLIQAWAFYTVGLRRLYAEILEYNGSSLALYIKKCGWRIEGKQKESIFRKGEWHDLYNLAILKSEFDGLANSEEFINLVCNRDIIKYTEYDFFTGDK